MGPRRDIAKNDKGTKSSTPGAATPENGGHSEGDDPDTDGEGGIVKILTKLAQMDTNFADLKQEIREGHQSTDFKIHELSQKLNEGIEKHIVITEKVQEITEVTEGLKTRSSVHGLRLTALEEKIEQLERDKRRNIIIIEGVIETEELPSPEVVDKFFNDLKVSLDITVCDRIYRRGKEPQRTSNVTKPEVDIGRGKRTSRPRPIVVRFKQFGDKIQVYKHLKNLKGVEKWDKVFVNDDLTELQQNQQRDLRALSAYARTRGYDSAVKANCIFVDNRKYAYRELDRLPQDLTLEKAKTIECLGGEGIAFQSQHSPLSNMYPCNFTYKGKLFLSAEGALQHTRAICCRRYTEASSIEFERCAFEVKRIWGTIRHPPELDGKAFDILLEILVIKFTSNEYCKKALQATGHRQLFEATGDKYWACGLPLTKIHELKLPTLGKNRTGEAVERVREIIKGE